MEDDIHDPVQSVFNVPVGAHRGGKAPGGKLRGSEEVAPFDRRFSVTPDLSLNPRNHGEVLKAPLAGEAPVAFQPVDFMAHGVPSDFDTAMTAVEGVVLRAAIGLMASRVTRAPRSARRASRAGRAGISLDFSSEAC